MHIHFREHFSTEELYRHRTFFLQGELDREGFRHKATQDRLRHLQQYIVRLVSMVSDCRGGGRVDRDSLRTPASLDSHREFDLGVKAFGQGDYLSSIKKFESFLESRPYSPKAVEALFWLVESHFLVGHYEKCLKVIGQLVDLYPKNPLTGRALLRMADIYIEQGRPSEAVGIYKTLLRTFPYGDLASQAREALRSMGL